jgi:hypothetical protein
MSEVSQCPKCELLFVIRPQLDDHLAHDHPDFTHTYVPSSSRPDNAATNGAAAHGAERPAATGPVRHVLVVANQTLGGAELLDLVRARMAQGPCDFSILVPANGSTANGSTANGSTGNGTGSTGSAGNTGSTGNGTGSTGTGSSDALEADPATPQLRLDAARDRFARLGAVVEGRVSDPDPLRAVEKAMARLAFDEVIISTLARGSSRWWRQDLPTRVQRRYHKPVTVISAREPARSS